MEGIYRQFADRCIGGSLYKQVIWRDTVNDSQSDIRCLDVMENAFPCDMGSYSRFCITVKPTVPDGAFLVTAQYNPFPLQKAKR